MVDPGSLPDITDEPPARDSGPVVGAVVAVLAVMLTGGAICWALDLFRKVGLQLYTEQYLAGMLAIALALVYLHVPAGKGRSRTGRLPWYDALAAALGLATGSYFAYGFAGLSELTATRPDEGLIPAAVLLVLLIEGLRRTTGNILTILAIGFIVLTLVGHLIPDPLTGRSVDWDRLVYFLAWDATAVLGTPMRIVTTIVTIFVLFGHVLFKSGGSEFFTDFAKVLMGRYRGGPAKISIFASSLFGSISGSVVSNVVTTGVITIPLMRRGGYQAHLAGAIEAVASTGGQLMPPVMGASAFLMAEFLQLEYVDVVIAALVPAILYYVSLFLEADLEAARTGIAAVPESEIPRPGPVLRAGWYFPLPFVVLIGTLFWLNYEPELAALLGTFVVVAAGMVIGFRGKRLGLADLLDAMRTTGTGVLDIFMIGGAAGIVIGALNISGLGFGLTLALVQLAAGNLVLLLALAAVVCILLGMGMPTVGVYVLLATLVAPALVEVRIDPLAAHLFILYFGMMSMITPPVCIGAFAAATLTGASPMKTGFAAMRFGWLAFVVPFLFVGSPTLLLQGEPMAIAIDIVTAVIACWLGSVAVIGYLFRPVGIVERIAFAVAALALLIPAGLVIEGHWVSAAGAVLAAALIAREVIGRERAGGRGA